MRLTRYYGETSKADWEERWASAEGKEGKEEKYNIELDIGKKQFEQLLQVHAIFDLEKPSIFGKQD